MNLRFFIALLLLVATINAVPLSWDQVDSSSCAPQDCDQIGYGIETPLIEFPVGKTLVYSVHAVTSIQGRQVVLESQVELSAHSQCELNLRLNNVRVQGLADSFELKQALEASPTQFGYQSGRVSSVCSQQDESEWVSNIKRALISSLQMSASSMSAPSVVTEDDLSGSCSTRYTPLIGGYFSSSSSSSIKIQKEKELASCYHRQHAQTTVWPRAYDSHVFARKVIPLVQTGSVTCIQTLESRVLFHVQCEEIQNSMGMQVRSNIELKLLKIVSELSVKRLSPSTLSRSNLLFASNPRSRLGDSQSDELAIIFQLRDLCSREEKEIVTEISRSFPALVSSLKSLDYDSLSRIQKSLNEFCQTQKVNDILLDAAREAGSESSYKLLVEQILKGKVSHARTSLLLLQLPFSQPQSARAIEQLLPLIEKFGRQAYLSVSAAAHNFLSSERGEPTNTDQLEENLVQAFWSKISTKEEAETVALIKSIQNVGSKSARSKLVELSTSSSYSPAIRVAAIQALAQVVDKHARAKLLHIFDSESETNEIRIQAYKALLTQRPEQEIIDGIEQTVSQTNNKQIISYVSTHSTNLISSSDPHRENILSRQIGENENSGSEWLSSRNILYSYLHEQFNLGVVVESDIIFPHDALVPRALSFNLSLPMYGKSVNVLAFELRQEGMDTQMNRFLAESRDSRDVKEIALSLIEFFFNHIASSSRSSKGQASLVVSLDGKVISVVSTQDLASSSASSFYSRSTSGSLLQEIRKRLESGEKIDSAIASQLIDSTLTFPSLNGFPLKLHINATIAVGLKGEAQLNQRFMKALLAPSVALDVQTGIHFRVNREHVGVTLVGHASSAPMIDIQGEIKEGRILNAKINFSREEQQLIKMEVYSMVNSQKVSSRDVKKSKQCIDSAHGLILCGSFSRPSNEIYDQEKILPAPIELEINLMKSDSGMKGFELQAEMPSRDSHELKLWRVSFNTPSSSIERELSAELLLANDHKGRQEVRVNLKSPWKNASIFSTLSNDEREKALNGELSIDGQRLVAVDIGVSSESYGKKFEMRPRLRVTIRGEQAINLQGSLNLSRGRKNHLQIDLHDARAQNSNTPYLKGTFMKEETSGDEFRLLSDVSAFLPGLVDLRVQSTANRDAKQASLDATIEYAFPRSRNVEKKTLKFSTEIQNLSSGQMNKLSAFGEISSTQFEAANWHFQYNLLRKANEHLENELTISSRKSVSTRVYLLQISKISSRSGSLSAHAHIENTLLIEATPLAINYELRIIGEKSRNPTAAYLLSMVGTSRDGDESKDARAEFKWRHISRSPLQIEMSASAKLPGQQHELAYKDTFKEVADGEYSGQSELSYDGKSTRVEYSYRTKSDSETSHHEFDAQIMNEKGGKFSSLLRMSRSEMTLRSRVEKEGQQLYNADFGMTKQGPIRMLVETRQFKLNGDVNQYSEPQRSANFEFSTSSGLSHKSSIHCTPLSARAWSFGLKSDTKRGAKPLLAVEVQLACEQESKLVVSHPQGDFDLSISPRFEQGDLSIKSSDSRGVRIPLFESKLYFEPEKSAAKFFLNTDSYVHSSSFEAPRSQNSRVIVLSSKTDYQRQPYIHVSLKSDQDQGQHEIEAQRGNDYYGRASADSKLNELKVEARRYSRHLLASVASKQSGGFKVDASWDLKRDLNARASLEVDTQNVESSGSSSSSRSTLNQVLVKGNFKSASFDLETIIGRGDAITLDSSISISYGAWNRSKSASIHATKNAFNLVNVQSMIDVSGDESHAFLVDFESVIKQDNNLTASISINSISNADLDFTLSSHVSPKGSVGLKWQNLNRSNKVETGFYLIQWNVTEQTIEIHRQDPVEKSLYLRAQLARESNEVDITIKRDGQEEKTLHAQAKAGCASISLEDSINIPFYRIESCLNFSKAQVFYLTADSIIEGELISVASLALEVRVPETLNLTHRQITFSLKDNQLSTQFIFSFFKIISFSLPDYEKVLPKLY